MVEDAVLEMAVVDVVVVGLPMSRRSLMKPRAQKRRHGDDGDASRQSSWKGGRCRGRRSQGRRGCRRKTAMQSRQTRWEREGRCRSRCSQAARAEACARFAGPGNASGTKARTGVASTGRTRERAPTRRGCAGRRRSSAGADATTRRRAVRADALARRRAVLTQGTAAAVALDVGDEGPISMTKTMCRQMAHKRLRNTVVDAQGTAM